MTSPTDVQTPRLPGPPRTAWLQLGVVSLGSFVVWLVCVLPIFFLARWAVAKYRATLLERLRKTRIFHAVTASGWYSTYKTLTGWRS